MRVVQKNSEIRLFLIAVNTRSMMMAAKGNPDFYVLLRTAKATDLALQGFFDLQSGILLPTYFEQVEHTEKPTEILRKMRSCFGIKSKKPDKWMHETIADKKIGLGKVQRSAVLVDMQTVRGLEWSLNDGFGFPIEKSVILRMRRIARAEHKRRLREQEQLRKGLTVIGTLVPRTVSINPRGLVVRFQTNQDDLEFIADAMKIFTIQIREEKRKGMKKAMHVRYASKVA